MLQKLSRVKQENFRIPQKKFQVRFFVAFLVLLFVTGGTFSVEASTDEDSSESHQTTDFLRLSEEIASLRSQVEAAHSELQEKKRLNSSPVQSLHMQEAELAAEKEREELLNRKLLSQTQELRGAGKSSLDRQKEFLPLAKWVFDSHKSYLQSSLPFRLDDRKTGATRNWELFEDGKISVDQFLLRSLNALTDESRMTRGTLLQTGVVWIGDKRFQAEMIKLGSLALLFRTTNGQYGYAEPKVNEGWQFVVDDDPRFVESVENLRQGLKKQIRNGVYSIPSVALNLDRGGES